MKIICILGSHKIETKVKVDLEDGMALFDEVLVMQGTLYRDKSKFQSKPVIRLSKSSSPTTIL